MNATEAHAVQGTPQESAVRAAAGGSMLGAIGGIAAIVLAIVGLVGIIPNAMAAIATIIIGAGLLMRGGAFESVYRFPSAQGEGGVQISDLGGGVTAEFLGGLAGIVLGILALFGLAVPTLLAVAVIVFGAAVLMSSPSTSLLGLPFGLQAQAAPAAPGGQILVGLAAIVLGILAVIGLAPMVLILVGLLTLGAGALFGGAAGGARMIPAERK